MIDVAESQGPISTLLINLKEHGPSTSYSGILKVEYRPKLSAFTYSVANFLQKSKGIIGEMK